jgi:hypothetical protein
VSMVIDLSLLSFGSGTSPRSPRTPVHRPDIKTVVTAPDVSLQTSNADAAASSTCSSSYPPRLKPHRLRGLTPSTELAREKNRVAAKKCRRKKKVEERVLGERKKVLHVQNVILQEAADDLVNEVLMLKHEILRHATCGFGPLDTYISHAANNIS